MTTNKLACPITLVRSLGVLLILTLSDAAQAQLVQFVHTTNNGTITITACNNCFGQVIVPDTINGLPVTRIGASAFENRQLLTSVVLPESVTSIGSRAFAYSGLGSVALPHTLRQIGSGIFQSCRSLRGISIPDGVPQIPSLAFWNCDALTNITLPNSITNIGSSAFFGCVRLTNVTIPASVKSIEMQAFEASGLTAIYFHGDEPLTAGLYSTLLVTLYYMPGTIGWDSSSPPAKRPWMLPHPMILSRKPAFGPNTNGFGFRVSWATNTEVVVEATINHLDWIPQSTNAILMEGSPWSPRATDGWFYFSDPEWTNHPNRFYRVRLP